jgi:hypothetical protein
MTGQRKTGGRCSPRKSARHPGKTPKIVRSGGNNSIQGARLATLYFRLDAPFPLLGCLCLPDRKSEAFYRASSMSQQLVASCRVPMPRPHSI